MAWSWMVRRDRLSPPWSLVEAMTLNPLTPPLPAPAGTLTWQGLGGAAEGLAIAQAALAAQCPCVLLTEDMNQAFTLEQELRFFAGAQLPVFLFPDPETLPYDLFSPLPELVSQRLATLYELPNLQRGVVILPLATALQRLPPCDYLTRYALMARVGQRLDQSSLRQRLERAGYRCVRQVQTHGEFAVRGALVDLFPMGSSSAYRLEWFDDTLEAIRQFSVEDQRSKAQFKTLRLLPAHEFSLDSDSTRRFSATLRERFGVAATRGPLGRDVGNGLAAPGAEYYLPLFFAEPLASFFDYLPPRSLVLHPAVIATQVRDLWAQIDQRYQQRAGDEQRPPLPPAELYLPPDAFAAALKRYRRISLGGSEASSAENCAASTQVPVPRVVQDLPAFCQSFPGRILLTAESAGQQETALTRLHDLGLAPQRVASWAEFLADTAPLSLAIAPLERGFCLPATATTPPLALITEAQLAGERALQRRRRKATRDPLSLLRDLAELEVGAPVVHSHHGIGRYLGLEKLTIGDLEGEFLTIAYAGADRLYVPVASLHLVTRYSGAAVELAPLHKLGGEQWQRAKRKALEQIRDVAAELLVLQAKRQAHQGVRHRLEANEFAAFCATFPFEETPDQASAIIQVIKDMTGTTPMDRVVCGDVGFGKTEVALRAAFIAAHNRKQVVLLAPTTLLAQQHFQTFRDRFAGWPVRIEVLSRFIRKAEQDKILHALTAGQVDIVVGTHKLLRPEVRLKDLGLVIVDEEHRFGVRDKERLKTLRAEVDLLTLTATPIPRTLNMALTGLRDLSIIATPPARRHPIKTFLAEASPILVQEALLRELKRGGQVYYLHNEVSSIEKTAAELRQALPFANIQVAHGQMHERELEQVMLDFYHRRCQVLVCSTIIESGIDVPNANTILIDRADKLGLAQLHQLRGRVGRSHHQAYAYLLVPSKQALQGDAAKRLEAITALEDLGSGFLLATQDLEIRGAGELLGEEQSGQMQELGLTLYTDLLEQAVKALKSGKSFDPEVEAAPGVEVELHLPALFPDDYLPDIQARLVLYKRISGAGDANTLDDLQAEVIDRFGLLPPPARNLFRIAHIKRIAHELGIRKIEGNRLGLRLHFIPQPKINVAKLLLLVQQQPKVYQFDGTQRLRVIQDLSDLELRCKRLDALLQQLQPSA